MMKVRSLLHYNFAAVVAATAVLLMVSLGVGAATASAAPKCPNPPWHCFYEWRYTTKYPDPDKRGAWRFCVGFSKSKHKATVTCALAHSTSNKVTTSVSGSVMIPKGVISANVGYEVEHTSSETASYAPIVPAHKSGKIQWAPYFANNFMVQQNRYWCKQLRTAKKCTIQATVYRFAHTKQYVGPRFRVVYDQ